MHRSVIFQWILGGFLGGIALASFFILPSWFIWVGIAAGMVCFLIQRPMATLIGAVLVAGTLGLWRTNAVLNAPSPLTRSIGQTVTLDGYVDGDAAPTKTGIQYPFHTSSG